MPSPTGQLPFLLGQLQQTVETCAEAVRTLSESSSTNARALAVVMDTVEGLEKNVVQFDIILRDNTEQSVLSRLTTMKLLVDRLNADLAKITTDMTAVKEQNSLFRGGKLMLAIVCGVLGWLITTVVALYAAFKGQGS